MFFFAAFIEVLGFLISSSGISICLEKLRDLDAVPPPSSSKQLQSFLGFANFFRRFVPAFATISAPLDALRHSTSDFVLDAKQLTAFNTLKQSLKSAPLLSFPDFNCPFAMATDASSSGIGVVLFQPPAGRNIWPEPLDNTCSIIAFFSRSLSATERNYATNKRELLAILFGLEKCRFYLWGRRFVLFTDHRSLTYLFTQRDLSPLLNRWFDIIMDFSFDIVHISGVANILPDAPSKLYPVLPLMSQKAHLSTSFTTRRY